MNAASKPIQKTDDESKQFIIDCLEGDRTHGFDIDSIYYFRGRWYIFEYLKCENENVDPHTSDPKYYAKNWRKFYSLYAVAKQLNGTLLLVNYSTREEDKHLVKVMEVLDFDVEKAMRYDSKRMKGAYEYMTLRETAMTRDEFSERLRKLNRQASLPELPGDE